MRSSSVRWSLFLGSSAAAVVAVVALGSTEGCALIAGVEEGTLAPLGGGGTGNAGATGGGGVGGTGGSGASSTGGTGGTAGTGGGSTGGGSTGGGGASGTTYAEEVLSDSPLGYWRLGEDNTPTAYDSSGNGHDGTFVGGITVGVTGAIAGDSDTAVHFDGAAEVTVGDLFGFEGNAPFTVEVWVKPEIADCSFIGKVDRPDTTYLGWLIYMQDNELTVRRGYNLVGTQPLLDQFTHVVATYDGGTLRLFENGQLENDRQTSAEVPTHSQPFTFGRTYEWVAFQGVLDEVAVYGTNLSPARILAHYEKGVGLR